MALWGCKAIVGLSATESNRVKFHQSETCNGVVAALKVSRGLVSGLWWCSVNCHGGAVCSVRFFVKSRCR